MDPLPLLAVAPTTLDATGLYASPTDLPDAVADYVQPFAPVYELWSDGESKQRWIYLPPCTQIDTSDMDHWQFPVGTRFWKEFTVPTANGDVLVETRFIHRFGPGPDDWVFAGYQWLQSSAVPTAGDTLFQPNGVYAANGTNHDIPSARICQSCHHQLPERILGFSAFELTKDPSTPTTEISMQSLSDDGVLTVPARDGFRPPGNAEEVAALGYLHANCGGCHNQYFDAWGMDFPPRMRLLVSQTDSVTSTDTYNTLIGVSARNPYFAPFSRVEPGDPSQSEVYLRMAQRGLYQMPDLATKVVDPAGLAAIAAWIQGM